MLQSLDEENFVDEELAEHCLPLVDTEISREATDHQVQRKKGELDSAAGEVDAADHLQPVEIVDRDVDGEYPTAAEAR